MHLARTLSVLLLLSSCTAGPTAPPPEPTAAPEPAPPPAADGREVMASPDAFKVLAASPLQIEAKVREAGLGPQLARLTPSTLPPMPPADDKDAVAFRTGIVFTIVLFSGRDAEKERFLEGVRALRAGLQALGSGAGWLSQIDDAIQHIENDAASRDDLLNELDGIIQGHIPEEGWGPDDKTGPLVQAGAWLMGFQLTAASIVEANNAEAANTLLKRPDVASFFLRYLQTDDGAAKASILRRTLIKGLTELEQLTKKDTLSLDDARRIDKLTSDLIKLLDVSAD